MIEKIGAILRNPIEYSFLERKEVADWLESQEPVAWCVMVRSNKTEWNFYGLYESERAAKHTVDRIIGEPLQVESRPLYSAPVDQSARIAELERQLADSRRAAIEQCASVVDWFIGCEQISSKIRALLDAPGKDGEA